MHIVLVGLGGIAGAFARFELGRFLAARTRSGFPVPTFVINLVGAMLLGLISGIEPQMTIYFLLGDGFLGAFTTFSTFMYEGLNLVRGSKKRNAAVYIGASLVLGVIGYWLGWQLGRLLTGLA